MKSGEVEPSLGVTGPLNEPDDTCEDGLEKSENVEADLVSEKDLVSENDLVSEKDLADSDERTGRRI